MATQYRKVILDRLISDVSALKHVDGTNNLFGSVSKHFIALPSITPVCEIKPTTLGIEVEGLTYDTRNYGFSCIVYDTIEDSSTDTEAAIVIDRISDIEDSLIRYLERLPNPVENTLTGIKIYNITIKNTQFYYSQIATGVNIGLEVAFDAQVIITPMIL